ncbi:alpha/beta hydrolase [Aliivibrio salmonicida]|uniref:alpha/beta hydrolase n=1 Tax=Aliivibrio salmonicida TaxID=40269 RepID=UPI003D0E7A0E
MSYTKTSAYFYSQGNRVSANLFTPNREGKKPAILLVAPQAGVKEQTVDLYAKELAASGYVCMTFDHTSFGDSEGAPRFNENPFSKVEDIAEAVTYLQGNDHVDKAEIYGLGICSGGGYLAYAAATDRRIKAVATVSAFFDHRGFYHRVFGREGVLDLLKNVNEARGIYLKTGVINYLPHAPEEDSEDMSPLFREFYDYYMTPRGIKGKYESKFLPWSFEKLLQFSALDIASYLTPTPLLMMVGSEAGSAYESENMYAAASEPKELKVIQGANHVDLYDQSSYVSEAAVLIANHFK